MWMPIALCQANGTAYRRSGRVVMRYFLVATALIPQVWFLRAPLFAGEESQRRFELHVIGLDGKPVPSANVELRTRPILTAEQIERGTFVKSGPDGVFTTTDAEGQLVARIEPKPESLGVLIITPGFGPYAARWSAEANSQPPPEQFTADLESGWSIGGVVIDGDGKPVEGAEVSPRIEFKMGGDIQRQLRASHPIHTDGMGKWRCDWAPASMQTILCAIYHPSFVTNYSELLRSECEIKAGAEPQHKVVLKSGLMVTGKVTDDAGRPIEGAMVRAKLASEIRADTTGKDGIYHLRGCEPRAAEIVVSAKGQAMDAKLVTVATDMEPVDFQMKPGGKIRIRIIDEQGRGIPRAQIYFQNWKAPDDFFAFANVNKDANENGVWEWNEAPLDAFVAEIYRPGETSVRLQRLIAREEEYVFSPPRALVVSGSVVDAETKLPIKNFQVVHGVPSGRAAVSWNRDEIFRATDGKYRIRETYQPATIVRVEAEGYRPAVSREIKSTEGNAVVDFELRRSNGIDAVVLQPDGVPARGAQVVLAIAGNRVQYHNGGHVLGATREPATTKSDEAGRFHFAPQEGAYRLVVTHPSGCAQVESNFELPLQTVQLNAWAMVEGVFRVGAKPVGGVTLSLNSGTIGSGAAGLPLISSSYSARTAPDGKFVFGHVFPGHGNIGRQIQIIEGEGSIEVTSSIRMPLNLAAGETRQINIGGTGRPVVGKLQPREGFDRAAKWNFATIEVEPFLSPLPLLHPPPIPAEAAADPVKKDAWMLQWEQSEEGKAYSVLKGLYEDRQQLLRGGQMRFSATVGKDGAFRIDNVPAGEYALSVRFDRADHDPPGQIRNYRVTVPAMEGGRSDETLYLGKLTLEK
jgi:hypothetical protein